MIKICIFTLFSLFFLGKSPEAHCSVNILVFSPHPDDDIIGCGGSIAKHVKQGNIVSIAYITSGTAQKIRKKTKTTREREATTAAALLGVGHLTFLRYTEGFQLTNNQLVLMIKALVEKIKPHIVYIPHKYDGHNDHMMTYQAVYKALTSIFHADTSWPKPTVLGYEIWTPLKTISYKEDITDFIDLKMAALQKHTSQLADKRYDTAIKGLNHYRAIMGVCGTYCEAFEVINI